MSRSRTERPADSPRRPTRATLGLGLLIAAIAFLLAPAFAHAAPGSSSSDLAPLDDEIASKQSKAREIRAQVQALDTEISMLVEEYDQAVYFLERVRADEQAAVGRVEKAESDLRVAQDRLLHRLTNVYKSGPLGILDILFGGDDLGGLTQRLRYFQDIAEGDKRFRDAVARHKSVVETERAALAEEREKRTAITAELEQKRVEVEERLGDRRDVLASVESDLAALIEEDERREEERARIAAEEAARAAREAEEAARRRAAVAAAAAPPPTTSRDSSPDPTSAPTSPPATAKKQTTTTAPPPPPASSSRGTRIVEVANQYLGVPYVWAGESPTGFDCSGLTKYVLAKVGVSLPHSSRLQFQMGTPVGRSSLEPGDLVFFGNPVHHVGIYAGGGQYIHAPYTGEVVKYSPFNRSDFAGARRF